MTIQACMGGKCNKRSNCLNYHAADRSEPAERLCIPGRDGFSEEHTVAFHRPVGAWESNKEWVEA
jgi:hypothetical protein